MYKICIYIQLHDLGFSFYLLSYRLAWWETSWTLKLRPTETNLYHRPKQHPLPNWGKEFKVLDPLPKTAYFFLSLVLDSSIIFLGIGRAESWRANGFEVKNWKQKKLVRIEFRIFWWQVIHISSMKIIEQVHKKHFIPL